MSIENLVAMKSYITKCCKKGDFTLTSGKKSNFYVDIKSLMFDCNALRLLSIPLVGSLDIIYPEAESVGGMELGSVPLTTAMALKGCVDHFVVRKQPRNHGTKSQIEGICRGPVVLVDDVLTTGGSLMKTKRIIEDAGIEVLGAIVVVNREDDLVDDFDIRTDAIFTKSQIFGWMS